MPHWRTVTANSGCPLASLRAFFAKQPALSLRAFFAKQSHALLISAFLFPAACSFAQSPDGPWVGSIRVMGTDINILVTYALKGDSVTATIDIPQQMALGLALQNVWWKPPKTHFELPGGPGRLAVFDGTIRGDSVNGTFTQAGFQGTFALERGKDVRKTAAAAPPAEPLPYGEQEVTYRSDSVTVTGTLTLPRGGGPFPAAILITGSGAHNRDEELFDFKPFRVIADFLTRRGIAVLRCDDRGIGGSTGTKMTCTTADHARDVLAGVRFLQGRPEINPRQIGLIGHSEGGLIAPIAGSQSNDVAFIVLLAGPAVTGDRLILYQLESQMRSGGATQEELRKTLSREERAFACARADTGWEELAHAFRAAAAEALASLPPERRKEIPDSAAFVQASVNGRMAAARNTWFRYFIACDPVPFLSSVRCPVLAVFGELDQQVPVALNREPMEEALKKGKTTDWKIEVIPHANHLLIPAVTGAPSEYPTLEKRFAPGFLDLVGGWITKRVTVPAGARE